VAATEKSLLAPSKLAAILASGEDGQMIRVSGQQHLPASAEIVRQRLTQMHWLVKQMPHLARVESVAEDSARFVVRPGFSFLRGEMTVYLQRLTESSELAWQMEVRGIGSSAQAVVRCNLQEDGEEACQLHYEVKLEQVGGLLRTLQGSLLRAAVDKTVQDFLANLQNSLGPSKPSQD